MAMAACYGILGTGFRRITTVSFLLGFASVPLQFLWAYESSLGGRFTHSIFLSERGDDTGEPLLNRATGVLRGSLLPTQSITLVSEGTVDVWFPGNLPIDEVPETGAEAKLRLDQAFAQMAAGGVDLRLGRQVFSWGTSDVFNPTDVFGSKDQTYFSAEEEYKRRGLIGLALSWIPASGNSSWNLRLVATFEPPKSRIFTPPLEPNPMVVNRGVVSEDTKLPNLGSRIEYAGDGWDTALSFYHGQNNQPEFQLLATAAEPLAFGIVHQEVSMIGADFSYSPGSWIFRLETAYRHQHLRKGEEELLQPDLWDLVIGAERPLGDRVRFHAQLISRNAYDEDDFDSERFNQNLPQAILVSALREANNTILNFSGSNSTGGTVRLTAQILEERLEAQIFHIYFAERRGGATRPSLKFTPVSGFSFSLGAEFYSGEPGSSFHMLKAYNSYFLESTFVF